MADSKLRLQIVTALDAAGIKATAEQIDNMEKSLSKVSKTGSAGLSGLENKLGKIPGPVGKLADVFQGLGGAIGKFGGTAMSVLGAFKVGWDIGSWVNEKIITPLFKIKDPVEQLKQENKKAAKEFENMSEAVDAAAEAAANLHAKASSAAQNELKDIEAMSNAWQKAARSRMAYMTAGQDVETQMLERQRFEDVLRLQAEGDHEGAEQANRIYDIFAAQLQAKHELAKFDAETAVLQKQITDNEEKQYRLMLAANAAYDAYADKVRARDKYDKDTDDVVMNGGQYRQYQRKMNQFDKEISALEQQWRDAERAYNNFEADGDSLKTRDLQRMALVGKTSLAVDRAALEYDNLTAQGGNALGLEFTQRFKDALAQTSRESNDALAQAIKEGVAEGIGELMQMK